jgi:hypothetical protein
VTKSTQRMSRKYSRASTAVDVPSPGTRCSSPSGPPQRAISYSVRLADLLLATRLDDGPPWTR